MGLDLVTPLPRQQAQRGALSVEGAGETGGAGSPGPGVRPSRDLELSLDTLVQDLASAVPSGQQHLAPPHGGLPLAPPKLPLLQFFLYVLAEILNASRNMRVHVFKQIESYHIYSPYVLW